MIPITKVKSIVDTYNTLEKELASGKIDKKNFVLDLKLMIITIVALFSKINALKQIETSDVSLQVS